MCPYPGNLYCVSPPLPVFVFHLWAPLLCSTDLCLCFTSLHHFCVPPTWVCVPLLCSTGLCLCLCFTPAHRFFVPPTCACFSLLCTYHLPQSFGALPQLLSFRQMARQNTWLENSVYCVQKHLCIRHGSQIIELSIFPLRCC